MNRMDPSYLGQPMQAPVAQRPRGFITGRTLVVLIALIAAIVIGLLLLVFSADRSGPLQQRTAARQETTMKLIADGQKNLSSGELKKINAELNVVMLSDDVALQTALADAGFKKADKEVVAAEADAETFDKLATAKINGQYDSTYRGVLLQKLESHMGLLEELHGETKKKSLKRTLATQYEHLDGFRKTLEKTEL